MTRSQFQARAGLVSPGSHVAVSGTCRTHVSWGSCRSLGHMQDSCLMGLMSQFRVHAGLMSPGSHVAVSGTCRTHVSWVLCRSFRHMQDSCLLELISQFQARAGFLSPRHRPALGPNQLLLQWEAWAVTTGLKWPCHEADHSFLSSVKVKMLGA